jgi:DNA-binding cell septation regulator SpoVG
VATITLNNALVLRSLRIIKDRDGELTVAYPTQMGRDRIHYDLVEPKSDSLRGEISRRVVAEFHRVVEQAEAPDAAGLEPAAPAPAEDVPEPTPPETTPEPTPAEVSSEQPDAEAASGPAPAETVPEEPTPPRY